MKVSIVIPCYNVAGKIAACLASLRRIDFPAGDFEVVFVDDASTDGTHALLLDEAAGMPDWRVERLDANTGSASRPRNRGIELARGDYVFFLDADDTIFPDTLRVQYAHAVATGADVVRGYLIADDGRSEVAMNRLEGFEAAATKADRIALMIGRQSTTPPGLIRTRLLRDHAIRGPDDTRTAEDPLFLIDVLLAATTIAYVDHPAYLYNKRRSPVASITQSYGARELRDHPRVWAEAEAKLAPLGISYLAIRLRVGLQTVLQSLVFRNRGDIDAETFAAFSRFVGAHWELIDGFRYAKRYGELLAVVRSGDHAAFLAACRPRLLVAGYDLKFIAPAMEALGRHFDIRVDEWRGHNVHDEAKSSALLEWAELIWCEWLLGNAVWYSARKRPGQRLVVRYHRMELGREFGDVVHGENVDAWIAVSSLYVERLIERFAAVERRKVRLVPNYIRFDSYRCAFSEARLFGLGMIGIVPSRKGLSRALDILQRLREEDPRYRLEVFGHPPEHYEWIMRQPDEAAYYEACRAVIRERGLEEAVTFHGHVDLSTAIERHGVGFVLSVSDSSGSHNFEAFHVAVLDAFAGGALAPILQWKGVEFIYPEEFIFHDVDSLVAYVREQRDPEKYRRAVADGRRFVQERYAEDRFVENVRALFRELI